MSFEVEGMFSFLLSKFVIVSRIISSLEQTVFNVLCNFAFQVVGLAVTFAGRSFQLVVI